MLTITVILLQALQATNEIDDSHAWLRNFLLLAGVVQARNNSFQSILGNDSKTWAEREKIMRLHNGVSGHSRKEERWYSDTFYPRKIK